ncbi:MAG: MFS transporter [Actinobacteria bacterium]|nr:MFS transporter [Actinomycetota bacterium]
MKKNKIFLNYFLETPNFLSIFLYPIFLVSISPVLLDISNELGIAPASLNLVLSFLIIGNIAGQLTSSLYNIKFRKFTVIFMLYIILLPLAVSLFFITKLYLFYIVYFACGYILGVIWIQANAFLLDSKIENKNRLINVALIFFPVGAIIAPLLSIAVSALNLSWRYLYAVIIFLIAFTLASYLVLKRKNKNEASEVEDKFNFKEVFAYKYQNRIFLISVLTLFFYGISETVIYTWSPTFFRLDRLMPP